MGTIPEVGKFVIKRHATMPKLEMQVNKSDGTPFDFTGAVSAKFVMKDENDEVVVDSPAIIVAPATLGLLRYVWSSDDTKAEGEFQAEFDVLYATGLLTLPLNGDITVVVYEDVNDA